MPNTTLNLAEEIACDALKLTSAGECAAFLNSACSGNEALRRAVEKIVAECDEVDRFLEASRPGLSGDTELLRSVAGTVAAFDSDGIVGSRVGSYKVLEKIGEGGCGVVYLAEQERLEGRPVALKVIKLGMDTRNVIARFEAERQALALMNHPNIARVLDAGATDTGRPFFVMELVHGVRITRYCDENRLEVRRRLELFLQVCSAIQHAHQKGIVHRDLKPSNILITIQDGRAVPKVIDFGIAKATRGERLTDSTVLTAYEQFVGTPAYMSPEQAQMGGVDVDTRSDIYSLGVLLYELLTGKTPFERDELLSSGLDEMRRTLLQREPPRPSMKLAALHAEKMAQAARSCRVETPRLKSLLKGDLDGIVMKALEKDRERRYQTANGFAADVQRYLNNEPVSARPPGRWYRLQKLVRRNRTAFAAIAAVSVALIAGFGTSTWLFFRERESRHEADHLRGEADARAKISQAALLINRNQLKEADQWVDKIEVPETEPSFEAAGVFRTLGEWNVTQGRWGAAAERYLNLERANQVDKSDTSVEISRDLLGAGPALIMAGELDKYWQFVQTVLLRFARTADPVAAEQVIKNSLILPPDDLTLRRLGPLVGVVEGSIAKSGPETVKKDVFLPWQPLALGLYELRRGNFPKAVFWGRQSLRYTDLSPPRLALAHIVLAMADARLNEPGDARTELAAARKLVEKRFPAGPGKVTDLGSYSDGVWHDWVIAYLLLREAEALIK